jgi:hypothetical protein
MNNNSTQLDSTEVGTILRKGRGPSNPATILQMDLRTVSLDPMLTTKQAALYLGRSVEVLKKWRQRRQGPSFLRYHDGRIRYLISEIQRYFDEHTVACREGTRSSQ